MNTNTTQTQQVAQEGFMVATVIETYAEISAEERSQFIYEQGNAFLDENFPTAKEWHDKYSSSNFFWKWWKMEWFQREQDFLYFIEEIDVEIKDIREYYISELSQLAHEPQTGHSFQMFLKIFGPRL